MTEHQQFKSCDNGPCQLDVPKMTGALQHPLAKRLTLEIPVDSAHSGVHESNEQPHPGRSILATK